MMKKSMLVLAAFVTGYTLAAPDYIFTNGFFTLLVGFGMGCLFSYLVTTEDGL